MYTGSRSQANVRQQLIGQLQQTLGRSLSQSELNQYTPQIQLVEPSIGKQFWQSSRSTPGIYLILAGKVRLFNAGGQLLTSLNEGSSFGELTLFPQESFRPYVARASFKLQLAFVPGTLLEKLITKDSQLGEHLKQQALFQELLLLCRQTSELKSISLERLKPIIPLLERNNLNQGQLLSASLSEAYLWLIRTGEIEDEDGEKVAAGSIYFPIQSQVQKFWQVNQRTELYTLSYENRNAVRLYSVELNRFRSGGTVAAENSLVERSEIIAPIEFQAVPAIDLPSNTTPEKQAPKREQKDYFPNPQQKVGHLWQRITKKYPYYAQQSVTDCGAACLLMIGQYWGKNFSLNRLRDLANVNRNGSTLRGLAFAAESIGFITRPIKATLDKFAEQKLPAIAHWENNHYIVVFEINQKHVIVSDPAMGPRVLTHREFQAGWTGYAMLLEPTGWLDEGKGSSFPIWRFMELLKPHTVVLTEVLVASIVIQIFGLVTPLLTQLLLDKVVVQRSSLTLMAVGMGLLLFGLFRVAITGLRQYLLDHVSQKVNVSLIVGFVRHSFKLPLSFFESRYVGDIVARLQENQKIQNFLTGEALSIFLDFITIFIYVGLMFWYSWQMALLALVIVPPFFILALVATPFLQKISRDIFTASAKEKSYVIEAFSGIATVKSMAVENRVRWRWEEYLNKAVKKGFSGQIIGNKVQVISSTIQVIATTAVLWFGAWQVIQEQLTVGQLIAFNILLGNVISPFQRLAVLWNQLQEVIISIERINDVLEAEPEEDWQVHPRQILPAIEGRISFQSVSFRYHPDDKANVIENLNFEVKAGQTIALVGRSGSGKSTLAKLILSLYTPTGGKILVDGHDLANVSSASLRRQVGVVDQANFLFGGTIRENISVKHPEASLEEIRAAAEQAGADEFIQKLPLKYETLVGERGGSLSGGQCQRLAIARALLGNPRLLILDEATSSLDAESERIIQNNLNAIIQDRTTIIIAHRLSTIRQADQILVLDKGVLVEHGTHDELMNKQGHYFYLNQQQLAVTQKS
ncbi:ATP-binding cassette domain-containing protein [Waterburya agarophytonicola K14]|uniref:ATP-binding cassette domain-containing protein n=1 Tax=Waterburya agarophytonicola KI4 TaxID=2874699 RepID=A0A964BV58_9CYAN|nr:ABC transporter transmembrane domain-containing protein [Waterburya agarophytonicola]MCC0178682.1 ATP-binding cassette domain-containing protein [Waterburya agarophytonicola KI4]